MSLTRDRINQLRLKRAKNSAKTSALLLLAARAKCEYWEKKLSKVDEFEDSPTFIAADR